MNDAQGEGVACNNLGLVYYLWKKHDKARDLLERSLKIARRIGDPQLEMASLAVLVENYKAMGDSDKALSLLKEMRSLQTRTMASRTGN
jgi:pentatricopeptide repeat protein